MKRRVRLSLLRSLVCSNTNEALEMMGIVIGIFLVVLSLLPNARFYEGRLGTKQVLPPIEPRWIPRLVLIVGGLAAILDGIWQIRHH